MMLEIPQPEKKKRALAYLRISDKSQIKGESVKTQREIIKKYADNNDIRVIEWFYDEAKSGKNTDREELQKLLVKAVQMKGKIDHVLVYKMSRISRDLASYITDVQALLAPRGISIISVTEPSDTATPMGKFTQNLYVLLAELDNNIKGEAVKHNMISLAKQGYWMGNPPCGYDMAEIKNSEGKPRKTLRKNHEAESMTKIIMRFNKGDIIVAELCRYAANLGVTDKHGKPLSQETMTKRLKNISYAGFVSNKLTDYEPVKGQHPALISLEVYEQNQEILKMKNKPYLLGLKHHKINVLAPLSRFIKCVHCHKYMTRERPGGKYRYTCKRCKPYTSITAELAHSKFEELLVQITPKDGTLKLMKKILARTAVKELGNINQDIASKNDELEELSTERHAAIKKNLKGKLSDEDLQSFIDSQDIERLNLESELYELQQQQTINEASIEYAINFMADIAKQWSDAPLDLKQKFQNLIFPNGFEYDIKNQNFIINEVSPLYRYKLPVQEAENATNSIMVTPRRIELLLPG